jgi:hypothetical protein
MFFKPDAYIVSQEFMTSTFDDTSTTSWTFSPSVSAPVTTCGVYRIVGGLSKFDLHTSAQKTFSNLPPHYEARIRVLVLKIDSWDAGEEFYLKADGIKRITQTFLWSDDTTMTLNQCGDAGYNEAERTLTTVFTHTGTSILVRLDTIINVGDADEYWGFSRFELTVYKCHGSCKTCTSSSTCSTCETNAAISSGICMCNSG